MKNGSPTHRPALLAFALTILLAQAAALAQPAPQIPTMADLQAMYAAKSYRLCLQQIYRVLNLRGDLAKPYDPGALILLRGYCLVALRDRNSAQIAFKAADAAATTPDQKIEARAMSALLTACPALVYQPADRSLAPIDIVNDPFRKKAMLALFDDRFPAVSQDVTNAQTANSLVPIQAVLPKFLDLAALEKVATGASTQTQPLGLSLGDRARDLINAALNDTMARDSGISQLAATMVDTGAGQAVSNGNTWWTGLEKRGLSTDDRNTLRQDIDFLTRIQNTVNYGASLARIYTGSSDRWNATADNTTHALQLAASTLDSY